MRKLIVVFTILLLSGCSKRIVDYNTPEAFKFTEEETNMLRQKERAPASTYGTYYGYSQPSILTRLAQNKDGGYKGNSKENVATCLFNYRSNEMTSHGSYSFPLAIDITNPGQFRKGQQISLPHKNIQIRVDKYLEGEGSAWRAKQPVKGIIEFEEINKGKIILSVLLYIENDFSPNRKSRRNYSNIIDYSSLEFLPENLEMYASDHASFSAKNLVAKEYLFSLFPQGDLYFKDSFYQNKKPAELKTIWKIHNLIGDPAFPGGLDSLNNFFKKYLPCPAGILKGANPNTIYAHLDIDRDGNVAGDRSRIYMEAFGKLSNRFAPNPKDPQYERDMALLKYQAQINSIIYKLPPFKVPGTLGINKSNVDHYSYIFPIILNCEARK